MSAESPPARPVRANSLGNVALWLLFAIIGLTALTLAFVHAPGRIKLIGLYGGTYGLVAGWALGMVAAKLHLQTTASLSALAFLLIVVGSLGIAFESHRIWAAGEWEAFVKSPTGRLANEVLAKPDSPTELRATLQESLDRQRDQTTFSQYLARRVSALGNWPAPWPLVTWLTEIALAAAAGCWVFRKQALALYADRTDPKYGS